jgi:hypothetical protein
MMSLTNWRSVRRMMRVRVRQPYILPLEEGEEDDDEGEGEGEPALPSPTGGG